jgi:hypothetical protein
MVERLTGTTNGLRCALLLKSPTGSWQLPVRVFWLANLIQKA